MKAIINYFVDLCLLRSKPQDLPASSALLAITFVLDVIVGFLLVVNAHPVFATALGESLLEPSLLLGVVWIALRTMQRKQRFLQTATALTGSSTFLGLIALPLLGVAGDKGSALAGLSALFLLLLIIWSLVVFGHIIRHTFDLPLGQGVALGVAYAFVSYLVLSNLFPVA